MTQTEDIILHAENFLKFQKQFQPTPVTASSGFYETVNILDKEFSKIYPDENVFTRVSALYFIISKWNLTKKVFQATPEAIARFKSQKIECIDRDTLMNLPCQAFFIPLNEPKMIGAFVYFEMSDTQTAIHIIEVESVGKSKTDYFRAGAAFIIVDNNETLEHAIDGWLNNIRRDRLNQYKRVMRIYPMLINASVYIAGHPEAIIPVKIPKSKRLVSGSGKPINIKYFNII